MEGVRHTYDMNTVDVTETNESPLARMDAVPHHNIVSIKVYSCSLWYFTVLYTQWNKQQLYINLSNVLLLWFVFICSGRVGFCAGTNDILRKPASSTVNTQWQSCFHLFWGQLTISRRLPLILSIINANVTLQNVMKYFMGTIKEVESSPCDRINSMSPQHEPCHRFVVSLVL